MPQRVFAIFLLLVVAASCFGDGSGLDAWMRVPGGQYVEGAMPEAGSGPEVVSLRLTTSTIAAGQRNKPIEGSLGRSATGYAIGLIGDTGYWLLPAELPIATEPDFPSFSIGADFSQELPDGKYKVVVQASDGDGNFGPRVESEVTASTSTIEAPLLFTLRWSNDADLDLHVVDPAGVEIYKGDINSFVPPLPGEPPAEPGAADLGALLDFDSNANCVVDGRQEENVIWRAEPARGRYMARVDTFSLCGEAGSEWTVEAFLNGERVGGATGTATSIDELGEHDRGAGVLALEIEVP